MAISCTCGAIEKLKKQVIEEGRASIVDLGSFKKVTRDVVIRQGSQMKKLPKVDIIYFTKERGSFK